MQRKSQGPADLVRQRWSSEILLAVAGESVRFNIMLRDITGISDRMLTQRLREMEDCGLVRRDVETGPPVRVWYSITKRGEAFVEPLRAIEALA